MQLRLAEREVPVRMTLVPADGVLEEVAKAVGFEPDTAEFEKLKATSFEVTVIIDRRTGQATLNPIR